MSFKAFKGQLQRFYRLMPYERAFKMLKNDMRITEIGQAVLEFQALKMGRGILIEVGNVVFRLLELPIPAENDVIVKQ